LSLPIPAGLAQDAIDYLVNGIFQAVFPDSEDCLTINVVAPKGVTSASKLPVVAWIFGGGFELGSTSMYDGGVIVDRSILLGEPVVYVSMNYRVSAFGFLAGKEVKDAGVGNLGLQDQREALRWIQKYIGAFGGDPTKVTIWGESAGAISVSLQMLTNGGNTEGLFRAGFMQSGSPIPVGDITHGQKYYDFLVDQTGCASSSDTLQCLRNVPYATLKAAMDDTPSIFSYESLALAWLPRADGVFLKDTPQRLVLQGSVANIPIVNGDCDDEGSLFILSTLNITTDAQFKRYMQTNFLPAAPSSVIDKLATLWPSTLSAGSPFDTGSANALTPQSKRLAAIQGDLVFQAPRRFFIQQLANKQKVWSYANKRLKFIPVLGAAHGTDILNVYGGGDMTNYLINFAVNLDPNNKTTLLTGQKWPQYSNSTPTLLTFQDGLIPLKLSQDTYRKEAFDYGIQALLDYPI